MQKSTHPKTQGDNSAASISRTSFQKDTEKTRERSCCRQRDGLSSWVHAVILAIGSSFQVQTSALTCIDCTMPHTKHTSANTLSLQKALAALAGLIPT